MPEKVEVQVCPQRQKYTFVQNGRNLDIRKIEMYVCPDMLNYGYKGV